MMPDTDAKPMKFYSNKQEKTLSDSLGWKQIGGSGAAPCAPGDIKASEWLGECKTHTKEHSIYFDISVWTKIKNEAFGHNKKPVLFVDNGTQSEAHTWCLCMDKNINQSSLLVVDLPFAVRKNISFDDKKGHDALHTVYKRYVGEFYQGVVFHCKWENEDVLIMLFETFKGVYKK